jgi:glycosyltransferase involved in cell wall biosynthesis
MVVDYLQNNYRVSPNNIRLIHRGISMDNFHPSVISAERVIKLSQEWRIPDNVNVVMLPGRLTRWKGHHVMIEAMAKLARKDIFCLIIGSDQGRTEYRKELETLIEEKNLGGSIRLVDHCNDMPAAYMLASVVVSASIEPEGFGRIPVEAQAMGRPIVATDHGGAQETVKRGETGWLVPPSDPDMLASAITEALSLTTGQRAILATRGMNHIAQHFTKDIMVEKTLSVYRELLNGKTLKAPENQFYMNTQTAYKTNG